MKSSSKNSTKLAESKDFFMEPELEILRPWIPNKDILYEPISEIGHGATGSVHKAKYIGKTDLTSIGKVIRNGDIVVVKKIYKKETHFGKNEIKALKMISHKNAIELLDTFTQNECIFLVLRRMESSLWKVVLTQDKKLTPDHHKFFLQQILAVTAYLHENLLIHRDIKLGNILINSDCSIKLCDFGDTVYGKRRKLSRQTQTLWYRAPEILLVFSEYTSAIDMWSIGCLFAELLGNTENKENGLTTSKVLFPGELTKDDQEIRNQLTCIFNFLGKPTEETMPGLRECPGGIWVKLQKAPEFLPLEKRKWNEFFPHPVDPLAIDLLNKFLLYDPEKRITAKEALEHEYFKD